MTKSKQGQDDFSTSNEGLTTSSSSSSTSSSSSFAPSSPRTPLHPSNDENNTPGTSSKQHRHRHHHHRSRSRSQHDETSYTLDNLIGGSSNSSGGYEPDDYSATSPSCPPTLSRSASIKEEYHVLNDNDDSRPSQYDHLQGKFSRPRRRTGATVQNSYSRHSKRSARTDTSVATESSDSSRFSRFSSASNHFSRGFKSQQQLHQLQQQQQQQQIRSPLSSSYNSLFGLGGNTSHTSGSGSNPAAVQTPSSSSAHHEEYHKHHHPNNESAVSLFSLLYSHHQQHRSNQPSNSNNDPESPGSPTSPTNLPSLKVVVSELLIICSLHCRYRMRSIRKPCRRWRQRMLWALLTVSALLMVLSGWILVDFYMDAVAICTPPPGSFINLESFLGDAAESDEDGDDSSQRPLVEYYVHGRGIGHYARSVAIVERLNRAGIDVRMFLTRAAMWRAMHEDAKSMLMAEDVDDVGIPASWVDVHGQHFNHKKRGKTTAISVASVTPSQNLADVISTVVERVSGDCEVSASSGRYPQLVISDGDFPGMLRAELGGIPSVGIAHGQLFSIAQKPTWVKNVPILNRAWNKQGTLNYVSGLFTEWQIATHFCFLESKYSSGTVARAPLRPEVLQMAEARKYAREGKVYYHNHRTLPQGERVRELLLSAEKEVNITSRLSTQNRMSTSDIPRRKLVICYFRDRNGEIVVKALLDAGFDVLLFDNGYYKDMVNDPSRYGAKWVVKGHEETRKKQIRSGYDHRRLGESTGNVTQTIKENNLQLHRRLEEVLIRPNGGPKLIRVMDRSLFVPLMHVADGVASSAGSQLMSECIYSHMPLYALYREEDDEQRLNVELSHHMDAPCHRPLVFGTSFESLSYALKTNDTHYATHSNRSPILESLASFIREVQSSQVSETYYRNVDLISHGGWKNSSVFDHEEFDDEDPFRGLPDASAIILEIVKQVVQKA